MPNGSLLTTLSIAELLKRFPQTISIFIQYRMACVGCAIAAFHTVAEAAAIYGVDTELFISELEQKIQSSQVG